MSVKLLIFDFDGVIADSFSCFYPMIRGGMNSVGISISENEYRNLFLGNVHQGFKNFINNDEKYKRFSEYRKEHYLDYYEPKIFKGAVNLFKRSGEKGYTMAIASSGRKDNVLKTLRVNNIGKFFNIVLATNEYSKDEMIKKILNKFKAGAKETIMITDTVGDIKVAKEMGLKTIAVTWGFHSAKMLKSAKPDYIANSFSGLTSIIFKR